MFYLLYVRVRADKHQGFNKCFKSNVWKINFNSKKIRRRKSSHIAFQTHSFSSNCLFWVELSLLKFRRAPQVYGATRAMYFLNSGGLGEWKHPYLLCK